MLNRTVKKIKIVMIEKEITGAEIARRAGVDRSSIHHVITGKCRSERLRQVIAEALGVTVDELWPEKPHKIQKYRKNTNTYERDNQAKGEGN